MDSNIKVFARIRPSQIKESEQRCIETTSKTTIKIKETVNSSQSNPSTFSFDKVFDTNSKQQQIYQSVGTNIVESVFSGINGTIFAYGQTSSGKTYTCMGPNIEDEENKGIIPRLADQIFKRIKQSPDPIQYRLKLSMVEIYMEKIRDLLDISKVDLKIRQSKQRGVYIQDLTEIYVGSAEQIIKYIKVGSSNRSLAHTNMNEASSRSHMFFMITIYQNNLKDLSAKSAKLTLVDLAGSQKVSKTGAEGKVLDEAKNINKSLSALGNVINALTQSKISHIPYRDSKLTRILQQSLGGNAKTNLIINLSPASQNESQTLSTLRFGNRAKNIKNKPKVNKQYTVAELLLLLEKSEYKIKQLENTIKQLTNQRRSSIRQTEKELQESKKLERLKEEESEQEDRNKSNLQSQNEMQITILDKSDLIGEQKEVKDSRLQDIIALNQQLQFEKIQLNRKYQIVNEKYGSLKNQNIYIYSKIDLLEKQNQIFLSRNVQFQLLNATLQEKCREYLQKIYRLQETLQGLTNVKKEIDKQKLFGINISKSKAFESHKPNLINAQKQNQDSEIQELKKKISKLEQSLQIYKHLETQKQKLIKDKLTFDQEKIRLYQDLQNRVEKVVELEEQLDAQKQQKNNLISMINMPEKSKEKRIMMLENYINELSTSFYVLKNQQSSWKNDMSINDNILKQKTQKIASLEKQLSQYKQNLYLLKLKYEELFQSKCINSDFIHSQSIRPSSKFEPSKSNIVKIINSNLLNS